MGSELNDRIGGALHDTVFDFDGDHSPISFPARKCRRSLLE
jgi:hypothetical protein